MGKINAKPKPFMPNRRHKLYRNGSLAFKIGFEIMPVSLLD